MGSSVLHTVLFLVPSNSGKVREHREHDEDLNGQTGVLSDYFNSEWEKKGIIPDISGEKSEGALNIDHPEACPITPQPQRNVLIGCACRQKLNTVQASGGHYHNSRRWKILHKVPQAGSNRLP